MSLALTTAKPAEPSASELKLAHKVVSYSHDSAHSLLNGFTELRKAQGKGTTTDEQQDLLRAMLLFASAGLDSCLKQIVRDALPTLAAQAGECRKELRAFALRKLRRGEDVGGLDAGFLADMLIGEPEVNLIDAFVDELTGSSLQSKEGLFTVARALGIADLKEVKTAINDLGDTFKVRNTIAHEMDINFKSKNRNRNGRKRDDMVNRTNGILAVADIFLTAVDTALPATPESTA